MSFEKAKAVAVILPELAAAIKSVLVDPDDGKPFAFVLMVSVDGTAQYVSNAKREDGIELIESLIERWKANRADIPAHYNPDLKP